jgi:hypothetical protein
MDHPVRDQAPAGVDAPDRRGHHGRRAGGHRPDSPDPDAAATPPNPVATLFRAHAGVITVVHRFESLRAALQAAKADLPRP